MWSKSEKQKKDYIHIVDNVGNVFLSCSETEIPETRIEINK